MQPVRLDAGPSVLRPHIESDIERVHEQCRDAASQAWTTIPVPYHRTDAEQFVRERVPKGWADGQELAFAVAERRTDQFLGTITVHLGRWGIGAGEVGFGLHPDARGRGVMAAAMRAVTAWSFAPDGLSLSHLIWRAQVGNWTSRRVAWATGFRVEGRIRGLCEQRGARYDGWLGTLRPEDPREPAHPWHEPVRLTAADVELRPFQPSDADAVVEGCSDPLTQYWLGNLPDPYTRDHALFYIRSREEEHASGQGIYWAAAEAGSGRCVGSFGVMDINRDTGSAEVGYWLHPAARGRGVTTSAVRTLVRHAGLPAEDGGLGLRRLTLRAAASNIASQRVADKAGFERVGVDRKVERLRDGSYDDLVRFDILL